MRIPEALWIVVGQALSVAGSFVGVRVVTAYLDPARYGELALGMTIATLVNQTLLGPLNNGVSRYFAPADEARDIGSYAAAVRGLVRDSSLIVGAATLVACLGLALAGHVAWAVFGGLALLYSVLSGVNVILSAMQNAARQRAVVALHQGADTWGRFGVAAALLAVLGASSEVALAGYCLATGLVLVSQLAFARRRFSGAEGTTVPVWRQRIYDYSWPFATYGLFTWAQLASDRWGLEWFAGTEDVGYYNLLLQIGYHPIMQLTNMVVAYFTPIIFQRAGDASDVSRVAEASRMARQLTLIALGATAVIVALLWLGHAVVFRALADARYAPASGYLPWVALSGGLFAAGQTIALDLLSRMRVRAMIGAKVTTALVGLALNLLGAWLYGLAGVVAASVVFSAAYLVWMVALGRADAT